MVEFPPGVNGDSIGVCDHTATLLFQFRQRWIVGAFHRPPLGPGIGFHGDLVGACDNKATLRVPFRQRWIVGAFHRPPLGPEIGFHGDLVGACDHNDTLRFQFRDRQILEAFQRHPLWPGIFVNQEDREGQFRRFGAETPAASDGADKEPGDIPQYSGMGDSGQHEMDSAMRVTLRNGGNLQSGFRMWRVVHRLLGWMGQAAENAVRKG